MLHDIQADMCIATISSLGTIQGYILYTMKVLRQKSFGASCTCRPLQKTFVESHILSLKSIFEQHHLKFSY